jgi:hypothetical protein
MSAQIYIVEVNARPEWTYLVEPLVLPVVAFLAISLVCMWALHTSRRPRR